jgi:hypothetical protein
MKRLANILRVIFCFHRWYHVGVEAGPKRMVKKQCDGCGARKTEYV